MFANDPYFESDDFKEVLADYERRVAQQNLGYMDVEELNDVADYYLAAGRVQEAKRCVQQARRLHPHKTGPKITLAYITMLECDFERANQMLDTIARQDNDEIIFVRAEIALKQEQNEEAQEMMTDFYQTTSCLDDEEARIEYVRDAARLFADYDQWDAASEWFQILLDLDPDNPITKETYGQFLIDAGRTKEAYKYINIAINKDTFSPKLWTMLAEAQYTAGDFKHGLESATTALDIDETYLAAHLLRGENLVWLQRYKEAHEDFTYYLRHKGEHFDTIFYFDGLCLTALTRYQEAYAQLQRAKDNCFPPTGLLTNIHLQLAYVAAKLGHLDEALGYLHDAFAYPRTHISVAQPLLEAKLHCLAGQWEEGERRFHDAVAESPDRGATAFDAGGLLYDMGEYQRALAYLLPVYKTEGDTRNPVSSYIALAYMHTGPDETYKIWRTLAEQDPNNVLARYNEEHKDDPLDDTFLDFVE